MFFHFLIKLKNESHLSLHMYVYLLKRIISIIAQKLDIIQHLERGVGGNKQELIYKFNIESFTIYDIKLQKVDGICFL